MSGAGFWWAYSWHLGRLAAPTHARCIISNSPRALARQALKHSLLVQLAVLYTRYLVSSAFVFAGLIKIEGHRFPQISANGSAHSPSYFFEMMYQSGLC